MRDAFGGVFMIRLMLVFVFVFVTFTAISLNYAKAFRVKNTIIDFVEQEELMSLETLSKDSNRLAKLDKILDDANYNKECQTGYSNSIVTEETTGDKKYCHNGIIIERKSGLVDRRTIVYNVYTYADWNLGQAFNMILTLGGKRANSKYVKDGAWEISGEARVVQREYDIKRSGN